MHRNDPTFRLCVPAWYKATPRLLQWAEDEYDKVIELSVKERIKAMKPINAKIIRTHRELIR
ncbi:hypothetical protein [Endozoicomonas sp. ALB032]|uniref:hypothetical protein n=1 Tax=Endozoicomonas sp. ALB032 TaxID=3403082 RepID=UPI003BB56751